MATSAKQLIIPINAHSYWLLDSVKLNRLAKSMKKWRRQVDNNFLEQ